jgi:hypothetical protein
LSRVRAETRWHIERKHWNAHFIDAMDQRSELGPYVSLQTDAKQRIDDDIGCGERGHARGLDGRTALRAICSRSRGIAGQAIDRDGGEYARRQPCIAREARQHITVTAVVAPAAQHENLARCRPTRSQHLQRRHPGAVHERKTRSARLNRRGFERTNDLDAEEP